MWVDILLAILIFLCFIGCFVLGFVVAVYHARNLAIKKSSEWVYNKAPRYIGQDSEGAFYMSVEGLREFENYMNTLGR